MLGVPMWNSLGNDHNELPVVVVIGARPPFTEQLSHRLTDVAQLISIPVSQGDSGAEMATGESSTAGTMPGSLWDAVALAEEIRGVSEFLGTAESPLIAGILNMNRAPIERAFSDSNLDQWSDQFERILYPVALSCEHLLPLMLKQGRGVMVNVAGDLADSPLQGLSAFEAGQAAVLSLSKSLVEPCAADGVAVKSLVLDLASADPSSLDNGSDAAPVRSPPIHATALPFGVDELVKCLLDDPLLQKRSADSRATDLNPSTNS